MKLSDLIPDNRNARKATKRSHEAVTHSLREFGAGRSILLDREGRIIAGNTTAASAAAAGIEDVLVVQTDGSQIIAVQRTDLDLEQDAKAKQLAIADNRTAEFAEWNPETLAELSADLDLKPFFTNAELSDIIAPDLDDEPKESGMTQEMDLAYRVIVDCESEQHQAEVMRDLEEKGLTCRLLIS